jgi:hypothetical protein
LLFRSLGGFAGGLAGCVSPGAGFFSGGSRFEVGFVEGAFVGDLLVEVLGAGAAAGGHHDAASRGGWGVEIGGIRW